ncbi:MAG: hypothetical protein Q7L19_00230 [Pseudohongiella sp.]|nr:hypothetical protein [Pseudohongiella sp.]
MDDSVAEVSTEPQRHAYDVLGPDQVLDAVEAMGLPTSARVFALNSYDTRNVRVCTCHP